MHIKDLVIEYGQRLATRTLENVKLPASLALNITRECENVSITTDAFSSPLAVNAMGPRASRVSIWTPYSHDDDTGLYEAIGRKCTNVVSLDLAVIGRDIDAAVADTAKNLHVTH